MKPVCPWPGANWFFPTTHGAWLTVNLDSLNLIPGHNWKLMNSTAWQKHPLVIILFQTGPRMEMTSRKTFAILIKMQHMHAVIAAAGTLSFLTRNWFGFPFFFNGRVTGG